MPHLLTSVQLAVDAAVRVQLTNSALLYSALIPALQRAAHSVSIVLAL
jgi:hypothetical protein